MFHGFYKVRFLTKQAVKFVAVLFGVAAFNLAVKAKDIDQFSFYVGIFARWQFRPLCGDYCQIHAKIPAQPSKRYYQIYARRGQFGIGRISLRRG